MQTHLSSGGLRVNAVVATTRVEGPHDRFAVWVAGCTLGCPGCCNPEMFDPTSGENTTPRALLSRAAQGVEGITVLGGEPLQQIQGVTELAARAQAAGLGVVISTGYTSAQARGLPRFAELWPHVDTLIAGPYVAAQREPVGGRAMVGSSNQSLIHRSDRYHDASLWWGPRGAEVVLDATGHATVLGHPSLVAQIRRRLRPRPPLSS